MMEMVKMKVPGKQLLNQQLQSLPKEQNACMIELLLLHKLIADTVSQLNTQIVNMKAREDEQDKEIGESIDVDIMFNFDEVERHGDDVEEWLEKKEARKEAEKEQEEEVEKEQEEEEDENVEKEKDDKYDEGGDDEGNASAGSYGSSDSDDDDDDDDNTGSKEYEKTTDEPKQVYTNADGEEVEKLEDVINYLNEQDPTTIHY
ncbi:hypothetical protein L1987_18376 [Smallanthus sonchifolius]|uniref:Uncharacterized protein n=1 Tax=Smallanthus sonchifolius TaxID=185202 RepID=A0ACB9J0L8_9ASTR|nr:hypothetical protein L1987_18376 [Smallanthus sonchifolius]